MEWNVIEITTLISALTAALGAITANIIAVINAIKARQSDVVKLSKLDTITAKVDDNTDITRHNCDVNALAIAHAQTASTAAIVAAQNSAETGARVEAIVNRIEKGKPT